MLIKTLPVGQLETNCYIVTNENTLESVVIDPGDESNVILDYLEDNKLSCKAVMLTHGHYDHIGAVRQVLEETGARLYMDGKDADEPLVNGMPTLKPPAGSVLFNDGDVIELAGLRFDIIATPGHTRGSVTIRCENALFTGDTLFKGSCGRVDLPGGSMEDELRSLKRLCALKGDYEVYPGHMDSTTLEKERMFNYYCRMAMDM